MHQNPADSLPQETIVLPPRVKIDGLAKWRHRPLLEVPYNPEYEQELVAFMAQGRSHVEFAAQHGLSKGVIALWEKEIPAFSQALALGLTMAEAWYEARGREGMTSKTFNVSPWILIMKNRFQWRDNFSFNAKDEAAIQVQLVTK